MVKWKKHRKKLGHSNLTMITAKYSGHDRRKKRQELQDCGTELELICISLNTN